MADQRPAFRFRLPWLPPQAQPQPPPRPAIAPRPVAPAVIPPRLPPRETTPVPPQPALETQISSRTPIQAPPQAEELNVPTPPPPPSGETQTPASAVSEPEAPLPPKVTTTESQSLSPSRDTTQSQVPSQPSSPSRAAAPPRILSQPPSPSRAAAQPRVPSQPSSPSRATAQPRVPSQPSSPSRATAQPSSPSRPAAPSREVTSQPSSPSRASPKPPASTRAISSPSRAVPQRRTITPPLTPSPSTPETGSLPQSGSLLTSGSTGQTSGSVRVSTSNPPEQYKPLSETITEQDRLQTSEKSPSPSDKEQEQKYKKPELKAQDRLYDERDTTTTNVESQPKHFQEETKEVKEVLKEINNKTYKKAGGGHEDDTVAVSDIHAKKEQTHESISGKKVNLTSSSNGKEGRNKTIVGNTDPHYPKQVNSTHIPRHKEIKDDITKIVHKMSNTEDTKNVSTTDKPVSVITLAGENRGAIMQLGQGSSKQRGGAINIHRGYKIKSDENNETTINEEGNSKDTKSRIEDETTSEERYVNSNIQGINNSIMFESSISERNPGVHIIQSQFPKETGKQNGKSHMVHTQKMMIHDPPPMVKRRCLRGLFLESSDSDDPSKPRRHGCRVGSSKDKTQDNNNNNVL